MLAMLDGFEDIRIERRPLAMKVNKNGKSLKIDQLSDGEKCTIALFGDLARRMALANPGKDVNPLEGSGVVLIDELDLHMHTSWQRKVLNVLRDTFPNIQFIITTHSPQILGEMDDSVNLLYLYNEDNEILFKSYESFVGWDANVILEEVMNTSSVNQDIKRMIDEMYKCIEDKKYDEAEKIVDILDKKTNGYADGISKARILISRGKRREAN
jgi:predicted ATP-binding protein involved in virulence